MYDKWPGLLYVLSTFYIRTLGSSRGYTTNVSPWFNPSRFAGIIPVFSLRIMDTSSNIYMIGTLSMGLGETPTGLSLQGNGTIPTRTV
jgi:hypothetical protein